MKAQSILISVSSLGKHLGSRPKAAELREQVAELECATIDFAGVELVSHSFADELIGKLAARFGQNVFKEKYKLLNVPEASKEIFYFVIKDNCKKAI